MQGYVLVMMPTALQEHSDPFLFWLVIPVVACSLFSVISLVGGNGQVTGSDFMNGL